MYNGRDMTELSIIPLSVGKMMNSFIFITLSNKLYLFKSRRSNNISRHRKRNKKRGDWRL